MSYNYKKVFFRRPILTESNLMLLWFLFFASVAVIPLFMYAAYYFERISPQRAIRELKNYTFSRLINIPRSSIADAGEVTAPGSSPPADLSPERSDESAPADPETIPAVLTSSAAENSPGRESPLLKYQQSRKSYEESIKEYDVANDGIRISRPGFTDFGVVRGYRSFEQTVATAGESKRFVQRCLDRFFLNHPRLPGKIIVRFEIHPRGHVIAESIEVVHSDIADESLLECVKKSIRRWVTYPEVPASQGIYPVTQKFIF